MGRCGREWRAANECHSGEVACPTAYGSAPNCEECLLNPPQVNEAGLR
jgi:hypothetical protein